MSTQDHSEQLAKESPLKWAAQRISNAWKMRATISAVNAGRYTNGRNQKVDLPPSDPKSVKVYESPPSDLDELEKMEGEHDTVFQVIGNDTIDECIAIKASGRGESPIGLDMASERNPGGSYKSGSPSQEEDICRRSDLWNILGHQTYPLPKAGGFYVPHVVVFRANRSAQYAFMDNYETVSLMCVAAQRNPAITKDEEGNERLPEDVIKFTIRSMYTQFKMAADNGHDSLVLGAFGCGAFHNPPAEIAKLYIQTVQKYFPGKFKLVIFAILPPTGNNFKSFQAEVEKLNTNEDSKGKEEI